MRQFLPFKGRVREGMRKVKVLDLCGYVMPYALCATCPPKQYLRVGRMLFF